MGKWINRGLMLIAAVGCVGIWADIFADGELLAGAVRAGWWVGTIVVTAVGLWHFRSMGRKQQVEED